MMGINSTLMLYVAELDRARELETYERLKQRGLLNVPPPPLRTSVAAWLLRLALRLDARIGESSSIHPEPTHA